MDMKVRIKAGFAAGLVGEATLRPSAVGPWYDVLLTYPEGYEADGDDLSNITDRLFYYPKEVEELAPSEQD